MALSRGYVVALLFGISLCTYVDRYSSAAVLNELQSSPAADGSSRGGFGLNDAQGGLVGSVFIITYMTLSPIFGYLGDRMPRIPLIFIGIVVWSVSTLLSSFVQYYWQFLFFRCLVGIGEASYAVLAPTIIADLYAAGTERTRVLGYYCASIPLGAALGFVYAGEVARVLSWRYVFRFSPFVSFLFSAVLLCCVVEPDRGAVDGLSALSQERVDAPKNSASESTGFSAFLKDVVSVSRTRSFFYSNLGAIGMTFTSGAIAQWAPAFLQRVNCSHGDADCESRVTRIFGVIAMITGVMGTLSGSQLSHWYSRRNQAADAHVCALGLLLATPCVYASIYLAPKMYKETWATIFVGEWLVSIVWAPYTAIMLSVVPPNQRGTANSLSLLTMHLGDSTSPLLIGIAADFFRDRGSGLSRAVSLQYALYLSVISTVIGAFLFIQAGIYLPSDRAHALRSNGYQQVSDDESREQSGFPKQAPAIAPRHSAARHEQFTLDDDDPALHDLSPSLETEKPLQRS